MKKILFLLAIITCAMTFASCGNPSADDVANKIENHEDLTEKDYVVMADYAKDGCSFTVQQLKEATNLQEIEQKNKLIEEKYPYLKIFLKEIQNIPSEKLEKFSKETQKKLDLKYIFSDLSDLINGN